MIQEYSGIPADNQGPINSQTQGSQVSGYAPSNDEEKAIKLVEDLFSKAKNARKAYDEKWLDNYKMFRGKQWKEKRPNYRHSEVINLIFRAIQSEVPILTDSRPKPQFIPTEPGDIEIAQILNDVLDSDWDNGNWLIKLTEAIYDGHFYGTGFGSLDYDPDASNGIGRIVFQSEDPSYLYPDPYARDVNENSNYIIHAEPKNVHELRKDYPKVKQFIKPDLVDFNRRAKANFNEETRYKSPTDSRTVSEGQSAYDLTSRDECLKIVAYIHDSECYEEEVEKSNSETGQIEKAYLQKLKYPNGRKIVICNGVLCEDGPIQFDDKKFPYLKLINYILPREFWGMSEVEQLESPQKIFNKLISFTLDVLTLMGNPIWIVDSTSGVDTDNLYNSPGLVVEKEKGSEVRREEGTQLQPYVLQLVDRMKLWFDDISGSTDSSRGVRPEGVTAASAIEALQEASQTRLRQKTRNIDAFIQDFGKMYASRVFQFYDSPRIFRITGNNNAVNYFKFHIEKRPAIDPISMQPNGDIEKVAKFRNYKMGTDGKYYLGEEKEYQIKGEFDVKVSAGSSLPFEKSRIEQQSLALFDRQIIDAEEVLVNIKYPNSEAVLKRMAEKQAMQMQQQAMMQATPAPQ